MQGVGYRWFARESAQRKGITGWVMNRFDGSVEVAAAGDEQDLDRFRSELRVGPPGAMVSGIKDLPPLQENEIGTTFIVKR